MKEPSLRRRDLSGRRPDELSSRSEDRTSLWEVEEALTGLSPWSNGYWLAELRDPVTVDARSPVPRSGTGGPTGLGLHSTVCPFSLEGLQALLS